jgi:hypothetical protein
MMVVMVVMVPVVAMMMMVVVAIAGDLYLTRRVLDALLARRTRGGVGRSQGGDGIWNWIEQLGVRLCALRLGRRGGRSGLRRRVERRQSGDGADGADEFLVHENFPLVRIRSRSAR